MQTYSTKDGDVLDAITYDQYPDLPQPIVLMRVFDANPGLADYGPVLPAGLLVTLPDIPVEQAQPRVQFVKFWG
jgi:phage tail protein X